MNDRDLRQLHKNSALLEAKWRPHMNAANVKMPDNRTKMAAVVFENQQRYLREECCDINGLTTQNIAAYEKQMIGLLRRTYSRLIAPEIVGTQPMPGPVSLIAFLRLRYFGNSTDKDILEPAGRNRIWRGGFDTDPMSPEFDPYYSLLQADGATVSGGGTVVLGDGATQDNTVDTFTVACPSAAAFTGLVPGSEVISLTGNVTLGTGPTVVSVTGEYAIPGPDLADPTAPVEVARWAVDGDLITLTAVYTLDAAGATTLITLTTTTSSVSTNEATNFTIAFVVGALYQTGMLLNTNCSGQVNGACVVGGPQNQYQNLPARDVSFDVCKVAIQPVTRKLRTNWSLESIQDLKNLYGLEADKELADIASAEISAEVDREIIGDLMAFAAHRATWFTKPPAFTGGTFPSLRVSPKEWYETLWHVVEDISAAIMKSTRRGGANFIVTDPRTASFFRKMNNFVQDLEWNGQVAKGGVRKEGTVGEYAIFVDPMMPKGKVLVGYKGTSEWDAGYVYAPYQPLTMTPTVWDECTFRAFRGVYTRYGKAMTMDGSFYYGVINVVEACDTSFLCS